MSDVDAELEHPWSLDYAVIASKLDVDVANGLTTTEVVRRAQQFGSNELLPPKPVPRWRKFLAQLRDPLTYLLIASLFVSFLAWLFGGHAGAPTEAIVIAAIVVANATLGYAQEAKAEQAVAALQRLTATTATVLRDGHPKRVDARDIVPGDILVLNEGDAIGADARLVACANLEVMEASLTGESEPVRKHLNAEPRDAALADRVNMVYKGTAVSSGVARAVVTHIGLRTEVGRIAHLLEATTEEPTPLERELKRVGKTLGYGVLLIAVVVVGTALSVAPPQSLRDVVDVLLLGVSLAVAAVPEGLPAVLSVVLALGVQRMAQRRAIVKKLSAVETLGSTSVICSDKTGTLTRNEMTAQQLVTASGKVNISGIGYRPEGVFRTDDGTELQGALTHEVGVLLRYAAQASNARLFQENDEWHVHGDPTEAALLVAERKWASSQRAAPSYERIAEIPFTSDRKRMSVVVTQANTNELLLITKGAPDVLLPLCENEQVAEQPTPLSAPRVKAIQQSVDVLSGEALRPLALAYRHLAPQDLERFRVNRDASNELEKQLTFVGVFALLDPARPEAATAIAEAKSARVRVMMITGDHPRTAQRIAEQLGLTTGRELRPQTPVMTGSKFAELDAIGQQRAVREINVFARVAPEHKLRIIDALQAQGEIVAMTGDGVNDAPALKSADIGIAMGITGTDVSKEAAKMILADDNFATIVGAIREGRLIFHNISGFLRYLLSSNTGEVLTVLLGVVFAPFLSLVTPDGTPVAPLAATQILWINLLTDAAPALALGVDQAASDLMRRPPRAANARIIDRSMVWSVLYSGTVMSLCTLFTFDCFLPHGLVEGARSVPEARTAAFTVLVLAQLFNCLNSRSHATSAFKRMFTNHWLWSALSVSLFLQVLVVHQPWLNAAFETTPLTALDWLQCTATASVVLVAGELRKIFARSASRASAAR